MEDVPTQKISQRVLQFECITWSFVVGAVIAGGGMYVDIRDNVSEVLGDHWYFLRSNIWWMPYYAVLISAPLLVICEFRRAVAPFVRRMLSRRGRVAADGHRAGDRSHPYTSTFLALYASAAVVASAVHTVVVNCIWSTLCARGEWGGTLLVSPLFFGVPVVLMKLRRTLWRALRRRLVAGE
jgi:hypothetical protein